MSSTSLGIIDGSHHCEDLVKLFNQCFVKDWNTQLIQGAEEPIYLPANEPISYNRVVFTRNYFSSALHEIAHWCIAGSERRRQQDYGYWYIPDGRSSQQQRKFERVESRPQALEWIFAKACNSVFKVSLDNLRSPQNSAIAFKQFVVRDAQGYSRSGLPERAALFYSTLADYYGGPKSSSRLKFNVSEL